MQSRTFEEFFRAAGGPDGPSPFAFQRSFAETSDLPSLVRVPTGLGKTAMAVVGWLWRRFGRSDELKTGTPRRLVYCLPMRVLVEQTAGNARQWIANLKAANELRTREPEVHVLMGGEDEEGWDIYPERDAILVGTQDMLLSRALNRGYAASRSRWPIQFGLLNADCLWIFDEIQLMGAGLPTTTQLEAFRRLLPSVETDHARRGHSCHSVWMSATMQRDWLGTVDFTSFLSEADELTFDFHGEANARSTDPTVRENLTTRWTAPKTLRRTAAAMGELQELAEEILDVHRPGTRTIIVVNTVRRARELYDQIARRWKPADDRSLVLLHSRFRPLDRQRAVNRALAEPPARGSIIVSTQVVEAGVDVSAVTLFTELAPWASLVQRFGRCNRRGEDREAKVFWIDVPPGDAGPLEIAPPYTLDDLCSSADQLKKLTDVGLRSLPDIPLRLDRTHVIRRKDLVDLFDTTPDLAGNDIDIDRFVREIEDSDVRLFWREYSDSPNGSGERQIEPAPERSELCPSPVSEFRTFAAETSRREPIWRWDFLDRRWETLNPKRIVPGQIYLISSSAGGYTSDRGWDPKSVGHVEPIVAKSERVLSPDSNEDDMLSAADRWQAISEHTEHVCRELEAILQALYFADSDANALRIAGRWHDWGKAHHVFQNAIDDGQTVQRNGRPVLRRKRLAEWAGCRFVAKAPDRSSNDGEGSARGWWRRYDWPEGGRRHFRHELASAIGVLNPRNQQISEDYRDLAAYLVAAHHGKVRLSIRSLPNETRPRRNGKLEPNRRFARGIWEGDELPATELGGGVVSPALRLSLEPMELGLCEEQPFAGQPSWGERMLGLRDRIGPFHLAYLEAIIRAADMRASKKAGTS